jgi:flagellar biogenesis protein FliO
MNNLFKQTDLKKLFYGIGIITLILMAMLFLMWDGGSSYKPQTPFQNSALDSVQTSETPSTSMTGYLLKVIFVTIFIIAVLIIGAKWFGKINKISGNTSFIKILSRQHVGPKQFLMMVAVEKKKILIGVTENSINHVMDMGEYNESDDAKYNTINDSSSFSSVLNYFKKGKNE